MIKHDVRMERRRKRALRSLIILLPLSVILFCWHAREMGSRHEKVQLELQTFQLGNGWGYQVMLNRKVLIYQPTIPSIDSLRPFPSEASARRIGLLVMERLKRNQSFSITTDDIIHSLSD